MAISKYVIAAMCGCWYRESGVNPGIWESLIPCAWGYQYEYTSRGGYGLGQWTNVGTSHGRLYRLHTWVTENGYADGEGAGQLAYITHENWWNGNYNGTGDNSRTRGSYGSLEAFLNSDSTDLSTLVWDFLANWEGVPGDNYSTRLTWAQNFLTYINNSAYKGASAFSWTSRNNYISESQTYSNVMCVYFYFGGYTPEVGEYTITVTVSGNGSASADQGSANTGDTVTLSETAGEGAEFTGWDVLAGGVTISDNSFIMGDENVRIRANFTGETPAPEPEQKTWLFLFYKQKLRRFKRA